MRDMTTAARAQFCKLNFPCLIFVELDFADGYVRMTNAGYSFTWNGVEWLGIGTLGKIEEVAEGSALQMYGLSLSLSGIPPEVISEAFSQGYQGRAAKLWLAPLTDDYQIIADPVVIFSGRMDTMDIALGKTATVTVTVESRLVDWERPRVRRFNDADQQAEYPGDRGFKYVDQMVYKDMKWGRL